MLVVKCLKKGHFDTSFAWIDPKIIKVHPIEGIYPGIWKKNLILLTREFWPLCTSVKGISKCFVCYLHIWEGRWRMERQRQWTFWRNKVIGSFKVHIDQKIFWQNFRWIDPFPVEVTWGWNRGQIFKMLKMPFHVYQTAR